jgi:hypothetical protein
MAKAKVYDVCVIGHAYNTEEKEGTNWITIGAGFPTKDGTGLNLELDCLPPTCIRKVMTKIDGTTETRTVPVFITVKPRTKATNASEKKKVAPKKATAVVGDDDVPF